MKHVNLYGDRLQRKDGGVLVYDVVNRFRDNMHVFSDPICWHWYSAGYELRWVRLFSIATYQLHRDLRG